MISEENKALSTFFSSDIINQLNAVFNKMENPLLLKLYLDNRSVSSNLKAYMEELSKLTDKISLETSYGDNPEYPYVSICKANGMETGLAFHGVPSGHEFTSFVLGLYNASGKGQQIDPKVLEQIVNIDKKVDLKIIVSLSCTMCPELVVACQKIASLSQNVTAHVYDVAHFDNLKNKYKVMSVPCLVVNDSIVTFGKKNIVQVLEFVDNNVKA